MAMSMVELLAHEPDLPDDLRAAVSEGRLEDAGQMLMDRFGLQCGEATQLVGLDVCGDRLT